MPRSRWYIRTYVAGTYVRREGFSSKRVLYEAIQNAWPTMESLTPERLPISDNSWVVFVIMQKVPTKGWFCHAIIETQFGATRMNYIEYPMHFKERPERSDLFRRLHETTDIIKICSTNAEPVDIENFIQAITGGFM